MVKTLFACLVLSLLLNPYAWTAETPPEGLPDAIRLALDQEYPGWKLAPVNGETKQFMKLHKVQRSPSLVTADFDGDGKRDYAIQIVLSSPGNEEQIVIVFLQRNNHFEEVILQSQGLDPSLYLMSEKRLVAETMADGSDHLVQKSVLKVSESTIGDTTYAFQNGEFHELKSETTNPAD